MDGMMMHPDGGGGGGGNPPRKRRRAPPSGVVVPVKSEVSGAIIQPQPVVLTLGTIIKLASIIVVPLLGILSAGIYFVHKTNTHCENKSIHLSPGERYQLETKAEAKEARAKLDVSIKREVKLQARELKQDLSSEQKSAIKKLGNELKSDQLRLLTEVKKARREIANQ
jgi:hypothetical protein